MKEENITVIICRPYQAAQIEVIPNCLEAMKMIVGGGIDTICPFIDPVAVVVNEDQGASNLQQNRIVSPANGGLDKIVTGTMLICGIDDDFTSIPEDLLLKYYMIFNEPEWFA